MNMIQTKSWDKAAKFWAVLFVKSLKHQHGYTAYCIQSHGDSFGKDKIDFQGVCCCYEIRLVWELLYRTTCYDGHTD